MGGGINIKRAGETERKKKFVHQKFWKNKIRAETFQYGK
jgi:hypothetical protein